MKNRVMQILAVAALVSVAPATLADTYTTIDFPGAVTTDLAGINASGMMVGSYTDSTAHYTVSSSTARRSPHSTIPAPFRPRRLP